MQHSIKKYLFDIKISIESIIEYLGEDKDFNNYLNNKIVRRAVERYPTLKKQIVKLLSE